MNKGRTRLAQGLDSNQFYQRSIPYLRQLRIIGVKGEKGNGPLSSGELHPVRPCGRTLALVGDEVTLFYDILFFCNHLKELLKSGTVSQGPLTLYHSMFSITCTALPPASMASSTWKILSLQPAIKNTSCRSTLKGVLP